MLFFYINIFCYFKNMYIRHPWNQLRDLNYVVQYILILWLDEDAQGLQIIQQFYNHNAKDTAHVHDIVKKNVP